MTKEQAEVADTYKALVEQELSCAVSECFVSKSECGFNTYLRMLVTFSSGAAFYCSFKAEKLSALLFPDMKAEVMEGLRAAVRSKEATT